MSLLFRLIWFFIFIYDAIFLLLISFCLNLLFNYLRTILTFCLWTYLSLQLNSLIWFCSWYVFTVLFVKWIFNGGNRLSCLWQLGCKQTFIWWGYRCWGEAIPLMFSSAYIVICLLPMALASYWKIVVRFKPDL